MLDKYYRLIELWEKNHFHNVHKPVMLVPNTQRFDEFKECAKIALGIDINCQNCGTLLLDYKRKIHEYYLKRKADYQRLNPEPPIEVKEELNEIVKPSNGAIKKKPKND